MTTARRILKPNGQCEWLLCRLSRKQGVTALEAAKGRDITSFHRRLAELRERGHPVDYGTPFTTKNGVRLKRYRLEGRRH